jgi:hypothetical protein
MSLNAPCPSLSLVVVRSPSTPDREREREREREGFYVRVYVCATYHAGEEGRGGGCLYRGIHSTNRIHNPFTKKLIGRASSSASPGYVVLSPPNDSSVCRCACASLPLSLPHPSTLNPLHSPLLSSRGVWLLVDFTIPATPFHCFQCDGAPLVHCSWRHGVRVHLRVATLSKVVLSSPFSPSAASFSSFGGIRQPRFVASSGTLGTHVTRWKDGWALGGRFRVLCVIELNQTHHPCISRC